MACDTGLPPDMDVVAHGNAASNAHLSHSGAEFLPNGHVVGNVYQIVDLRSAADDGVTEGTTIHGAVGSDFHIIFYDAAAHLRNAGQSLRAGGITEAVDPETHARVEPDPVAHPGYRAKWYSPDRSYNPGLS